MDIRKLQRAIVDGLEDVKAQDIVVFDTEHLSPLFERVIVASGQSNRQTKALASSVRETVKSRGFQVLRMEGEGNGEWIIVDCGAAVVHVMQPAIREYYHLEEIWGDKPVRLKLGAPAPRLARAAESAPAAPVKKTRAKPEAPTKAKDARKAAAPAGAGRSVAAAPSKPAPVGKTTRSGGVVGGAKAPAKKAAAPRKAAPKPAAKAVPAAAPKPAARKPASKVAAKTAAPTRLSGTVGKAPVARKAAAKGSVPAKKAPARKTPR